MVQKPRIVIDTNVWLSGIIFGGLPEKVIQHFLERQIDVVFSEELLSELRRKVAEKFPLYLPHFALLESSLREDVEWVKLGSRTVKVSRDPDDNKVIETALLGSCSYIVSGDKDLLIIEAYKDVKIVSPSKFLEILTNKERLV